MLVTLVPLTSTNGITNGTIGKTLNGICLPMVPFLPLEKNYERALHHLLSYVGTIGTIGTNGITNGTIGKTMNGGYVRGSPNGKICKSTNGTVGTIFTNGNQKTLNDFCCQWYHGTIGRPHGGIFIILINTPHLFLSFLFTSCISCCL